METRKLTEEETERLFDFCCKHYVPEYDLQIELVDHLASGIEEQWQENPYRPLSVALNNTFDKFGIYGFSKVKEQKEKGLRREYRRLFWQYTIEFYKLPKVLLTIALTFLLFLIYRSVGNFYWVTVPIFVSIMVFDVFYFLWIYPSRFKIKTTDQKSFLLINYLNSRQIGINLVFQIPLQGMQLLEHYNYSYLNHTPIMLMSSFAMVCLGILLYIFSIVIPMKVREHFTEQFPQFILS